MALRSPPQSQPRGQLPDFARLSVALAEENGVGHTYLGEFGAHHQEDQEAEELPGRLHVSRLLRCPGVWGLGAGGWRLRGRGRAPGWGWGSGRGSGSGGACSAAGAGGARVVLRRASALHIYGPGSGATASRAGLGRRGGGCACFSPRARRVPALLGSAERRALQSSAARPGCSDAKSLLGEGRGRGWRRGTGAPRLGWEGRREGGGRRGGRLGQDVTSKRRGKLNWARQLHPGGLRPRGALKIGVGNSSQGPLSDERMVKGSVGDGWSGILRGRAHKLHRWSLLGDP